MKKLLIAFCAISFLALTSCEVEYRGDVQYHHPHGWHHAHYPEHHDTYNHGYHHDEHGGEVIHHDR